VCAAETADGFSLPDPQELLFLGNIGPGSESWMEPAISALLFAVLLFGGMLGLLEIGRRVGIGRRSKESEGERASLGTIEGAMFALFGLVVAFTFSARHRGSMRNGC